MRYNANWIDFAKIKDSKGGFMSEENTEDANKKMIEEWKQEDRLNQARKWY